MAEKIEDNMEYPKYVWPKDVNAVAPNPARPNDHGMVVVKNAKEEEEVTGVKADKKPKDKGW